MNVFKLVTFYLNTGEKVSRGNSLRIGHMIVQIHGVVNCHWPKGALNSRFPTKGGMKKKGGMSCGTKKRTMKRGGMSCGTKKKGDMKKKGGMSCGTKKGGMSCGTKKKTMKKGGMRKKGGMSFLERLGIKL